MGFLEELKRSLSPEAFGQLVREVRSYGTGLVSEGIGGAMEGPEALGDLAAKGYGWLVPGNQRRENPIDTMEEVPLVGQMAGPVRALGEAGRGFKDELREQDLARGGDPLMLGLGEQTVPAAEIAAGFGGPGGAAAVDDLDELVKIGRITPGEADAARAWRELQGMKKGPEDLPPPARGGIYDEFVTPRQRDDLLEPGLSRDPDYSPPPSRGGRENLVPRARRDQYETPGWDRPYTHEEMMEMPDFPDEGDIGNTMLHPGERPGMEYEAPGIREGTTERLHMLREDLAAGRGRGMGTEGVDPVGGPSRPYRGNPMEMPTMSQHSGQRLADLSPDILQAIMDGKISWEQGLREQALRDLTSGPAL
jgi:hypothetical protein